MAFRMILILVEGTDDEMFFNYVVRPKLAQTYDYIQIERYSEATKGEVNSILYDYFAMNATVEVQADAILVADLNASPCVTDRKERIRRGYRSLSGDTGIALGPHLSTRIFIVCREIESWYLAGLSDTECKRMGIATGLQNTDHLTKEQFLGLIPGKFNSRAEFMLEILSAFDHETARTKNSSFSYFMQKYGTDS